MKNREWLFCGTVSDIAERFTDLFCWRDLEEFPFQYMAINENECDTHSEAVKQNEIWLSENFIILKKMSDKELSDFLCEISYCNGFCPIAGTCKNGIKFNDWLSEKHK